MGFGNLSHSSFSDTHCCLLNSALNHCSSGFAKGKGCRLGEPPRGREAPSSGFLPPSSSWLRLQKCHQMSAGWSAGGNRTSKLRRVQWARCPALGFKGPDFKQQLPPYQLFDFGEFSLQTSTGSTSLLMRKLRTYFQFSVRTHTSLPRWIFKVWTDALRTFRTAWGIW